MMIHDRNITDAILEALAGWLQDQRTGTDRGSRLPGVYETKRGLEARFFRMVDGKRATIRCGTGKPGLFTKAEEERLHQLWKAATAAWDEERR